MSPLRGTQLPNRWAQHPSLVQVLQYVGSATHSVTALAAGRWAAPPPGAPPVGHSVHTPPTTANENSASSSSSAPPHLPGLIQVQSKCFAQLVAEVPPITPLPGFSLTQFLEIRKEAVTKAGAAVAQSARIQLAARKKVIGLDMCYTQAIQQAPQEQATRALGGLLHARTLELERANEQHRENCAILDLLDEQDKMITPEATAACDRCLAIIPATLIPSCRVGSRSLALLLCPACAEPPHLFSG